MRFESFSALRGCLKNSPWLSSDKTFVTYDISQFFQGTGMAGKIAVKFTNKGQILLEYHLKEDTCEIEFSVADTGMGIEPDKVDRVFDRFVKLNTFSKGTGLGLSICRSIIEHLGGTIGVESEMGTGSRFCLLIPTKAYPYKIE